MAATNPVYIHIKSIILSVGCNHFGGKIVNSFKLDYNERIVIEPIVSPLCPIEII